MANGTTSGTFPEDAPKKGSRAKASPTDDRLVEDTPVKDTGAQGFGETPRSATKQLKEEADRLTRQATDRARSFADEGKERATGALDEFSKMMREAADTVDARIGSQYGQYARSAADQIAGFADSLRNKQVDELVDDARDFVRKSPAVAIGTAAAVGFVLARLVKSGIDAAADAADRDSGDETDRA